MPRARRKRDANEPEIVHGLRALGALVILTDEPCDLVVGFQGRWTLLEVKNPDGRDRPQRSQVELEQECKARRLPFAFVRSLPEALAALGIQP